MKLTPMMKQYCAVKEKHPDCLVLFRVGDFFELFFEDAEVAARDLNIALTSRDGNIPMAGVPHHALESYLGRLVKRGHKVAICDQVEDAQQAKGLVRREVVRIVTPGTIIEDNLLDPATNNWLLALTRNQQQWGVAFADVSTGEFCCSEFHGGRERAEALVASLNPSEMIVTEEIRLNARATVTTMAVADAPGQVEAFFGGWQGKEFLRQKPLALKAVAMIAAYLEEKGQACARHLSQVSWHQLGDYLYLDAITQRNLELLAPLAGGSGPSLLKVLDKTATPMGGRLLKTMLVTPLADAEAIWQRLDCVQFFHDNYILRQRCRDILRSLYDLERIASKISYNTANARDLLALAKSLEKIPALAQQLDKLPSAKVRQLGEYSSLCTQIFAAIQPEPPVTIKEGNIIRTGYSPELDQLRELSQRGSSWIKGYEQDLRQRTGIKSLKIGFNKVFGYYIEVTKANLDLVPAEFIRKQTLVNAERFETQELKGWEEKILSAKERVQNLEYQLFCQLREQAAQWIPAIQTTARAVAYIDCLLALAEVASAHRYCRPEISPQAELEIAEGRHPVVEQFGSQEFVPNDCRLDAQSRQILIITGPNMAGKSTYMRQVALIALLAHIGSFVPASRAKIGILDGIFTRIGASDDLASGQSTFMVEMSELARILDRATPRSLILLDEIGRGTGTSDGLCIARATIEYLHSTERVAAMTMFATHYHQLIGLAEQLPRVANCSVQVSEQGGRVTFLHKIAAGGSDRSYGIYVARLAGLPEELVARASCYLAEQVAEPGPCYAVAATAERDRALEELVAQLAQLDLDSLSPRQAWQLLDDWQKRARTLTGEGQK